MSIQEKALKGVFWSALQNWGSQAGSLVVFFLLARLLAPEAFGLVAMANIFLALLQIFLQQGFAQSLIQRQDLESDHIHTAFWSSLAIGFGLFLIGFTGADFVAAGFHESRLTPILQALSWLFLVTACGNVQQALLERAFNFKATATRVLVGTIAGSAVGIAMALSGFGVWSLVVQQIVQELVGVLVLWRASAWRPQLRFSFVRFRELFQFGFPIIGFNFLNFINSRADDLLIGYFLGAIALGYYSIAYRILTVMQQLLVQTTQQIALPTFSRLQNNLEQFRQTFYTATKLTSLVAFPTFLGVAVLAPELIVLIFGKQWLPSIPVLQVLALAGLFQSISFFKSSVFVAMGKPSWSLWLSLLSMVLNLIGFSIAVRWGIVAVAVAFVVRGYLVFPIGQWAVSRLINAPVLTYLKQFAVPLASAILMSIVILLARHLLLSITNIPILIVLVSSLLGTAVYAGLIRFLSPSLFTCLLDFIQLLLMRSKAKPSN
ncbi:lipopolysaccharide biosynthesis protein [Phormidium sp. FACHB-592]|uniref:Lipopolysaccharide biosynthesis protein n=1 Tax=Stenomitos frigidus AS-A4 TaxID=2933935 RepID=A0ABV0KHJ2_9CYAN|nr:lipopolysaccharide biosynthesis protein [Phormidium sp. FACHB-592]MBD2073819.1 lipopolysaccharide biosynthesis protein [Phormidium sp. FACHB-592]